MTGGTGAPGQVVGELVVSESVSIDGVIAAPGRGGHLHGAWTMPYRQDHLGECATAQLLAAGTLLLGRVTYRGSADRAEAREPAIVRGEMRAAVQTLRDRHGADVLVVAGATLLQGLLAADLVDELRLEVYPVALGVGTGPFRPATRLDFEVAESTQTASGVMLLTYRRVGFPAEKAA